MNEKFGSKLLAKERKVISYANLRAHSINIYILFRGSPIFLLVNEAESFLTIIVKWTVRYKEHHILQHSKRGYNDKFIIIAIVLFFTMTLDGGKGVLYGAIHRKSPLV